MEAKGDAATECRDVPASSVLPVLWERALELHPSLTHRFEVVSAEENGSEIPAISDIQAARVLWSRETV